MSRQDRNLRPSDLPSTRRSLPIALIRAREAVMTPIRDMLAGTGLTEQQWRVLRVLDEFGPLDSSELAGRAGLMASSLTRIVQTMTGAGLLKRHTPKADRRRQVIAVTDAGRAVLQDNKATAALIAASYRTRLGAADYEQLLDLLERLSDPE